MALTETDLFLQVETNLHEQFKLLLVKSFKPAEHKSYFKNCVIVRKQLQTWRRETTLTGTKQNCDARIRRLKSNETVLRNRMQTGAGLQPRRNKKTYVWEDIESAFENRVRTGLITNLKHLDLTEFLTAVKKTICTRIRNVLRQFNCIKIYLVLSGDFVSKGNTDIKYFQTPTKQILPATDLQEWYTENVIQHLVRQLEEFQERDSGWALTRIINLTINVNRCEPLRGFGYVELPAFVKSKKAVVNVESYDDACFAWAVVSGLYPATSAVSRPESYPHYKTVLNVNGIKFPMTLNQIKKFEIQNALSINVYALDFNNDSIVVPIYLTTNLVDIHLNLFVIRNESVFHFCWIKNLSRLVSSQITTRHKMHLCDRCLSHFYSHESLLKHTADCREINECAVNLPSSDDKWLKFKNYYRREFVPYVVYADFECYLERVEDANLDKRTKNYQKHVAYSVGYYVHCAYDRSLCRYEFHRGDDCDLWFAQELKTLAYNVEDLLTNPRAMFPLTENEKRDYANALLCHICGDSIESSCDKVRDHCHLTGKYRGPAHSNCNIRYTISHTIPVIFHNLTSYDAHFMIEQVAVSISGRINVVPLNKEKYISFTKNVSNTRIKLRFIDSFRFMSSSLSNLVGYLNENSLLLTRANFANTDREKFALLTRKGVFPYDYVDGSEKLLETALPSREDFFNKLTNSEVSVEDYEHAKNVWIKFNIKTLGEYSDLYLKTDVLLLADVFENFRQSCSRNYNLDPAHYYTIPGLAWDAMLRISNIKLELLTDIDMVLFVERGIRGGVSQCSNRHAVANNPYAENFNRHEPENYLMYFDVNNLYGWAMSKHLPFENFRWIENVQNFPWSTHPEDSSVGYILEVDLEYPVDIHDLHKDLPFCPNTEKPPGARLAKLMTTFTKKERYVTHYVSLQQAVKHGIKLTRIHRILAFSQSPWMKSYIDFNTNLRTLARNDFDKNLFKLMNNAVFGKTMENVRKRVDIKLVTQWFGRFGANALISAVNFHRRTIFTQNFMAIELQKLKVCIDKPIYVGMAILDISKTCLYEFHYDYMLKSFPEKCKLLYTDTDSLIYDIQCENFYSRLRDDLHRFDTSDYASENVYKIPLTNKKVPGLMKDENNGEIMLEFVGLRSKMYSIRMREKEIKRAKGVKNYVVKNSITFLDYLKCLRAHTSTVCEQNSIRSQLHKVFSQSQKKIALSPEDNKRALIVNSTDTLPWGHYSL